MSKRFPSPRTLDTFQEHRDVSEITISERSGKMGSKIARAKRTTVVRLKQVSEKQANIREEVPVNSKSTNFFFLIASVEKQDNDVPSDFISDFPNTSVHLSDQAPANKIWAKIAISATPKTSELPGNLAFQKSLIHYASTTVHPLQAIPRSTSSLTVTTVGTFHSNGSIDSEISTNTTNTTPCLPSKSSTCEKSRYYKLVDDEESLADFLSTIGKVDDYIVDIFADTEGENRLGKEFNINGITIKMVSEDQRWLIDPKALGDRIFNTPAKTGKKRTLAEIFESKKIPKVWFDVRADSNAIHGHYNIRMGGVIDLQVMEMATRGSCPSRRPGLDRCIQDFLQDLPAGVKETWMARKQAGKLICSGPERYGVFNQRPLPRALEEYAINDVELMPELFNYLSIHRGMCDDEEKMRLTLEVSEAMVELSVSPDYRSQNPDNKYGPTELADLWPYDPYEDWDLW